MRHHVVFDCNVYLDVLRLTPPPDSLSALSARVFRQQPVTSTANGTYIDAVTALAFTMRGSFIQGQVEHHPLHVWTCEHIVDTARYKATPEYADLIEQLIVDLVDTTNGTWAHAMFPVGNPPLDHEDGNVYAACRYIEDKNPHDQVYCVTSDKDFLKFGRSPSRPGMVRVISPRMLVAAMRAADMRAMRPRMGNKIPSPSGQE